MKDGVRNALKRWPLDHVGIAVHDLEEASLPYETLGLARHGEDEEIEGVRVRAFIAGESLLELLAPTSLDSPIAKYLEKSGPGMHHLALRVRALDAEITRLKALGVTFVAETPQMGRGGTRVVFLHPRWGRGVLFELVEHP